MERRRRHASRRTRARKRAGEPVSSKQPAPMVRVAYFGGLHRSLIVSTPGQAVHRSLHGRAPPAIAVISTLSSVRPMWRKAFVAHRAQARGKASQDAGHLPVQAVEFAQQICAEEKIAHDWLLETGGLSRRTNRTTRSSSLVRGKAPPTNKSKHAALIATA
jgi:hypothetical protein